ncbi:MAG: tRNA/tmRNA/rRNA uracil-C5-methylase (TrmA/RlmC/RlmD family) [Candidatus Aldehydirespiratoraceae bacterium]|jgi:tRNA/tmRNA/rRNA uracil-C5-methylase (TrmA/RlmC/RlmD family)
MELHVSATARDGAGVARAEDGRIVFVEGALAGETVSVEMIKVDKRWSRARVVRVLDASPERVPIPCTHQIEGCGGCDLLHVAADAQLRMKSSMVVDQLVRAEVEAPDAALRSLDNDQGRTTVRAAIVDGRAGYRIRGSHDIVVPEVCEAVDPIAEQLLIDGRFGDAKEVTIRVGNRTGERLVMVEGSTFGIELPDDVLIVGTDELAKGKRAWIHEEAGGRRWRVSARSFFQNRPAGVDALVEEVGGMVEEYGTDGPLVDAYAGIGIFAGTVGVGRSVYAIERGKDSSADARVNLEEGDVKIIKSSVERWRATPAAVVIADPAREGLGKDGVNTLLRAEPDLFVLVSCDPSAFAKDAARLIAGGMSLARMTVVDMFPGTSHVETVGAFVR